MAGALFYRKQSIEVIKSLDFKEMKYWYKWHEVCAKEEAGIETELTNMMRG
jgi:hypothetical protein